MAASGGNLYNAYLFRLAAQTKLDLDQANMGVFIMSSRAFFLTVVVSMVGCGDSNNVTPTAPLPADVPFT